MTYVPRVDTYCGLLLIIEQNCVECRSICKTQDGIIMYPCENTPLGASTSTGYMLAASAQYRPNHGTLRATDFLFYFHFYFLTAIK